MPTNVVPVPPLRTIAPALERARLTYWEEPVAALEVALDCRERARTEGIAELESRALALQGAVSLHGGDLRGAFALAAQAATLAGEDLHARAELAALNTHLHFLSGSYGESLEAAMQAVDLADRTQDTGLRLHARRMACLAFGNVGVDDLDERFQEMLALAMEQRSPWEEAVARNDLAHLYMVKGDHAAADDHLATGLRLADGIEHASFLRGVLHATRSELKMAAGRADEALEDARAGVTHVLAAAREANPYLLGMAVLTEVQALLALGHVDEAQAAAEGALQRLGERVPQARGMILTAVAAALREAGRAEDAYDTLARASDLEREALQEFAQLQRGMERARLEAEATRREADALSAKNRQLEGLVAELAEAQSQLHERAGQLELLQDQLREQADRDWLTGLRNRRFLARARDGLLRAEGGPVSLAIVDLDHFKSINDRFGHPIGDEVLVRVASLLLDHVRAGDIVVRTGGEEFVVLMPGARKEEAVACCERLRAVIAGESWERLAPGLALTASIGVVSTSESLGDPGDLERVADERLYTAKRRGRDRVVDT